MVGKGEAAVERSSLADPSPHLTHSEASPEKSSLLPSVIPPHLHGPETLVFGHPTAVIQEEWVQTRTQSKGPSSSCGKSIMPKNTHHYYRSATKEEIVEENQ